MISEEKQMAALGFSRINDTRYERGHIVIKMLGMMGRPWYAFRESSEGIMLKTGYTLRDIRGA